jgi:hypothetical protein
MVAWFARFSDQLVLLEEFSLHDVVITVRWVEDCVRSHIAAPESPGGMGATFPTHRGRELAALVRSDHHWFGASLAELTGLREVVERDDHGGHRQALGQYGRLLSAALARHRRDEAELERLRDARSSRPLRNPN